ncbi:hypothetical protein C5167_028097 [Papaver somniferum]|uniref:high mobility group nucleosome-binding domain-containing protein 5-like n=1 Tax=Papaver somniferum TaxID=3469 RepID=UPI000E6FDBBF|nr:high mobility group nucleosome-binding domain-containing protein 5-like [Papaver somniferum]RZC92760.1 hypothetical protein C5167_028097 [Papaver somniferum]
MARTEMTARLANQIPNLVDIVKAAKDYSRTRKKSKPPEKEMAPIRSSKNKKDKNVLVTPPSKPPRNLKYLNAGLLRGKTSSEVAAIIREPREPCADSDESSSSLDVVIYTTPSDEEEVAEHEEEDGNDGNGGNHGDEETENEEEGDQGNDGNGSGRGDEEGVEDDGNDGNGNERDDGGSSDKEEDEIQEQQED